MPVFLFSDIEGSTQKWETFRDAMARALAAHDEIMLNCMKRFGGKIIKNTGDGVFAMFENRDALKCALALQEEMTKADWSAVKGLRVRLGLHAGEAEKRGEDYFGPVINRTARILATGWGGQIVLTPEALAASDNPEGAATESLGTHLLKDLADPQPLLGLVHASSPEKFPPLRSLSSRPNNLPAQSTPFFGREEELKQISAHFKDPACRMITLVGQGGMGKTRLSLQAAAERLDDFSDGVYFIPLASVTNPNDLVSAVAAAVGFFFSGDQEMNQQLLRYLKDRSILLVLDNFEHLLVGASLVGEILNAAPKIKILVTSRFRLNLLEENVTELGGMACPENDAREALESFSAVKFFVTCAQRTQKNFTLSETDAKEAARICRLVDGVPLGIELAAAWIRTLSCGEIREEIEKSLDFLASKSQGSASRHQSLRAVFEYSWSILSDEEKKAVRAISVFRGGFLRDAAEKAAGCSLRLLSDLLDKSLLRKSFSNRFEMHELIRQFSEEKLKALPEEYRSVREKHGQYFCDFLAAREKGLISREQDEKLKDISGENSNIRAAWQWVVENQKLPMMNQSCNALFQFFETKSLAREGEEVFGLATDKLSDPAVPETPELKLTLSRMMARQGWFCYQQGRVEKGEKLMKRALVLARELGQAKEIGDILHFLCALYSFQRKFHDQQLCAKESLEIFKNLKEDFGIAWSYFHLAQKPKQDHDNEAARKDFLESLGLFRKIGYGDGMAWNLVSLGQIAMLERNFEPARKYFDESLEIFERHDNKISAGMILLELSHLYEDIEDYEPSYNLAKKAYQYFQTSNNRLRLAWAQLYCTDSAFNMGRWEDSLSAGRDALRLFSEEEDQVGQGWTYANLCRANNQGLQFEEGRVYGQKGVDTFTRLGDKEGIGGCQYHLAFSELGLNHLEASEELFFGALENGLSRKINWRVNDAILGIAIVKAKTQNPALGFFLASVLLKEPELGKDLKVRTLKFVSGTQPLLGKTEIKEVAEKIKPFSAGKLAVELLAKKYGEMQV